MTVSRFKTSALFRSRGTLIETGRTDRRRKTMTYSTLNTCLLIGALALTACHKAEAGADGTAQGGAGGTGASPQDGGGAKGQEKKKGMGKGPLEGRLGEGHGIGEGEQAGYRQAGGEEAPNALTDQLTKMGLT